MKVFFLYETDITLIDFFPFFWAGRSGRQGLQCLFVREDHHVNSYLDSSDLEADSNWSGPGWFFAFYYLSLWLVYQLIPANPNTSRMIPIAKSISRTIPAISAIIHATRIAIFFRSLGWGDFGGMIWGSCMGDMREVLKIGFYRKIRCKATTNS